MNSLYPFASKNPMPGKSCRYIESFQEKGLALEDLFGFFYCEIESPESDYFGLLLVRDKSGI